MELSENDIQNSILEFLKFKNLDAIRVNNGSSFDQANNSFRKKNKWEDHLGTKLDIFVFLPGGKYAWIEVKKNEKEKLRSGQKDFVETTQKNGGIAFKAYSLKCVKEGLKDYL